MTQKLELVEGSVSWLTGQIADVAATLIAVVVEVGVDMSCGNKVSVHTLPRCCDDVRVSGRDAAVQFRGKTF